MVIDGACGIMLEVGPSGNGYELGGPACGTRCGGPACGWGGPHVWAGVPQPDGAGELPNYLMVVDHNQYSSLTDFDAPNYVHCIFLDFCNQDLFVFFPRLYVGSCWFLWTFFLFWTGFFLTLLEFGRDFFELNHGHVLVTAPKF